MVTQVDSIEAFKELVGTHLGYSDYKTVTQEEVNLFADATGDHQWIHVDPERDRKSTRLNSSHVKRSRMPSSA